HTAVFARSRMISMTKLATLVMAHGDPREAAAMGNLALDAYGPVRSKRARNDMYLLRRVTTSRATQVSEAAELQVRISETI
ncbi:MAG TPA: XRE family transcriptional regulator, partial [Actinopolymorphaceae bacterium]|nr:XRE family transcriptional regulator [Actinopolymorphaceae bacterium]